MGIGILLAEDHRMVREGLHALLQKEEDLQVLAEATDGREAVELAGQVRPDVVVMDISMPGLNGIDAARQIVEHVSGVRVIALSMHSDKRFVSEALRAGASGYVLKDSAFDELASAVRTVSHGQNYLSPAISGVVIQDFLERQADDPSSAFSTLTRREREVLQLLAEGNNTKQIALALEVSVKTIETHRQHLMKKLDIRSIAELTKYAIREGLTSLEP